MAASIAGKPVTNGGQTSCITLGQDAKNGCKPYAVIRSIHDSRQSPESRFLVAAKHPASRPGRMSKSGANHTRLSGPYMAASIAGKPVTNGGQITCTTRVRMPKIESKRSAAIGYT
ncbi:hypothetical protein [Heyndrickxia coagulans]|uniref:hypothetical protein n=1 Tax=Heyndrickxia coagulans TaxID=1398 RepID=UPI00037A4D9B|nr:hypothetical protein [Heyndrickxia coagulans]